MLINSLGAAVDHFIELFKHNRELGFGIYGAFFGALFAWHQDDEFREIFFKAVITGSVSVGIDDLLSSVGAPPRYSWIAIIVIAYIGVEVLLSKLANKFGLERPSKTVIPPVIVPAETPTEEKKEDNTQP